MMLMMLGSMRMRLMLMLMMDVMNTFPVVLTRLFLCVIILEPFAFAAIRADSSSQTAPSFIRPTWPVNFVACVLSFEMDNF